ncbi:hypothetical protein GTA08_BOTSDO01959 [Neofusicoccum parvum]|uniref:Uncharacterized protein n=3 Tax=Neofusicoccum TaxID=407951 RepID=R1GN66_BOTPV|nr:hypothetical protein UCRNP2_5841 [Neofusicoccum parvum UCRNP2]GME24589.1 hypothetical protein GTA08_BOTSDO01959 [Neofusicoccum parvum]GME51615.1 hypothetical protein GTA08_BOTSDO01959 [Neofusicoccum parvum]
MSVTTTENRAYYNTVNVLADYELHHSRADPSTAAPPPNPNPAPAGVQNPDDWPTDRRRVPAYRPVQPDLDQSTRRVYQNPAERTFITIMFTGVRTNAGAAQLWRKTGGKLWDIRYKIGGEW